MGTIREREDNKHLTTHGFFRARDEREQWFGPRTDESLPEWVALSERQSLTFAYINFYQPLSDYAHLVLLIKCHKSLQTKFRN